MPKKKADEKKISNCKLCLNLRESSNNCIKATQTHLKKQFVSLKKRFYKEKSRIGNLTPSSLCAQSHSYCITLIRLVIELIVGAAIGPRTVQNVLKILSEHVDIATPARSTIGQWFSIIGLYIYNLPIKNADDWIWLIDLSIPVGVRKLFIILGIRKSDLKKGHINVRHKDMTIIHMEAVETVSAQVILKQLNKAKDKVGYAPAHLGSDGGTELKKAKDIFCKENPSTCPFQDISHMCANIMKGLLKDDKRWNEFTTFIIKCKAHIAQTNIGFLCPPKQRTKARFLGLSRTTKWAFNILNSEGMGDLCIVS